MSSRGMASKIPSLFGLELYRHIYLKDLRKREDLYVLHVHWLLVSRGFQCIGLGDSRAFDENDKKSELLPENWNAELVYLLRYVYEKKLYLLRIIIMDNDAVVNFIRSDDMKIASLVIPMAPEVKDFAAEDVDVTKLAQNFQKEIFAEYLPNPEPKRKEIIHSNDHPTFIGRPGVIVPSSYNPQYSDVGRADLDPLAAFTAARPGGMLFPTGMIPEHSGVRYDPTYPVGPGNRGPRLPFGPDPDHMRAPRFGDDLFM